MDHDRELRVSPWVLGFCHKCPVCARVPWVVQNGPLRLSRTPKIDCGTLLLPKCPSVHGTRLPILFHVNYSSTNARLSLHVGLDYRRQVYTLAPNRSLLLSDAPIHEADSIMKALRLLVPVCPTVDL
jgi:hypothetical protein